MSKNIYENAQKCLFHSKNMQIIYFTSIGKQEYGATNFATLILIPSFELSSLPSMNTDILRSC